MEDLFDRIIITIIIVLGILSVVFIPINEYVALIFLGVFVVVFLIFILKKIWEYD